MRDRKIGPEDIFHALNDVSFGRVSTIEGHFTDD